MALKRKVRLINEETNKEVKAPIGTSWTTVFFYPLVPLFRKDWKNFGIQLGVGAIIVIILSQMGNVVDYVPNGLLGIIFGMFYNKMYISSMLEKGYKVAPEDIEFYERNKDARFSEVKA
ncbi:DUF2628 domain-containing protein [Streptococcus parauberis]|uniref:DUF2628 domain-containing protein n=1 Tax=Streptococcus parauberis TaxID=1348 RepID=UPI00379EB8D1